MRELWQLSIAEAGEGLHSRRFTATELVSAVLQRAAETEPRLHAYARLMTDQARDAAAAADREILAGRWRGPLHGIPIGVKDLCYTAGVPTEAGSRAMAGFVTDFDATVVRRLREAGAVIAGKTVTHEFAYGQNIAITRSPWDESMSPGGSSAGSGVATAVGSAMGSIGTDTGGSIRQPADFNGVVGLKPTFGRVSRHGVVALSLSLDHVGPITQSVEDCAILLQAIAGHDPLDPASASRPVPDYREALQGGVRGMRLGLDRSYFYSPGVEPRVRSLVEAAERELEQAGAELVPVSIPALEPAAVIGLTILQSEASDLHRDRLRRRADEYEPGTRLNLEFGQMIPAHQYATAIRARRWFARALDEAFKRDRLDALLAPTSPLAAIGLEQTFGDYLGGTEGLVDLSGTIRHGIVANLAGLPALTVPCGLADGRYPVGLQIIGRPFDEAGVLRIGREYERRTAWNELRVRSVASA
jgi:aspartyl-tRNA(Asn)/glutamyl-tRNA(Gln) amidotransferase subunit A